MTLVYMMVPPLAVAAIADGVHFVVVCGINGAVFLAMGAVVVVAAWLAGVVAASVTAAAGLHTIGLLAWLGITLAAVRSSSPSWP